MAIVKALIAGAGFVNFNIRALGGHIGYFQSLSILGYSMFPLLFTTVILKVVALFKIKYMAVIMIAQFAATLWAILCNFPPKKPRGPSSSSTSTPPVASWLSSPSPSSTSTLPPTSSSTASIVRLGLRAEMALPATEAMMQAIDPKELCYGVFGWGEGVKKGRIIVYYHI
jgi:hypothetical protein